MDGKIPISLEDMTRQIQRGLEDDRERKAEKKEGVVETSRESAKDIANIPPLNLDLESLKLFSEKQELETRKSYEVSLDRAIEALKGTEGIVELKNQDVPTIIISDLHARRDFLMNVLSQKDQNGQTVLDLLKDGKVNIVCLGDGMHSEVGKNWYFDVNWEQEQEGKPPKHSIADADQYKKVMEAEMIRSLGMMKMVMDLKAASPDYFHYVRGNHDDIKETIFGFMKYVPEDIGGESGLVRRWTTENYGQDFLDKWAKFESMLPLVVQGKGFVASHTIPEEQLTRSRINDREKDAARQLLWTDNTDISDKDPAKQHIFRENLKNFGAVDSKWVIGHRRVPNKYRQQFGGQLIQINSSVKQLVAVFYPDAAFDPERNIFNLTKENIEGLNVGKVEEKYFTPEQQKVINLIRIKMKDHEQQVIMFYTERGENEHLSANVFGGIMEEYASRLFAVACDRGIFSPKQKEEMIKRLSFKQS